jgi:DNA-directed RNA polymerase specialized sigma24 family protein
MPAYLTPTDLDFLCREADRFAWRLIRQTGLPGHEQEDLRQDLLVDLIARLKSFDPACGTLGAFAGTVVGHRAGRLANRIRRERSAFAPVSLDDPLPDSDGATVGDTIAEAAGYAAALGQPTDQYADVERRVGLERALATLSSAEFAFCIALTGATPTTLGRAGQGGRSSLYRRIAHLRLDLIAAGLAAA